MSDNHASYTKIGLILFFGIFAIVATCINLGSAVDADSVFLVETYSDEPVGGLSVGSAVNFRGVKVGDVRSIDFVMGVYSDAVPEEDAQRIRIVMALSRDMLIRNSNNDPGKCIEKYVKRGVRASISSSGITGISHVEFGLPDVPAPIQRLAWRPEHPLIPPQPSLMTSLSRTMTLAINRFNQMDFASVWSNVQSVTESAARVADNLDEIIVAQRSSLESSVRNVDALTGDLRALTSELRENPSLILRPRDPEPLPETER